jgi:cytochrome c oxidase subunit 3
MKSLLTARGNPYVTMVWLAILGSVLLFLFLVLLFFARTQSPGWSRLEIPVAFLISTVCILLSSVTLHFSRSSMKNEEFRNGYYWLSMTLLLALGFGLLQYSGIRSYISSKLQLSSTAFAFTCLFSGLHFLHIVLGAGALLWVWNAFRKNLNYVDAFLLNINPITITVYRTATIFWHFLGLLWLLLLLVLLSNQP